MKGSPVRRMQCCSFCVVFWMPIFLCLLVDGRSLCDCYRSAICGLSGSLFMEDSDPIIQRSLGWNRKIDIEFLIEIRQLMPIVFRGFLLILAFIENLQLVIFLQIQRLSICHFAYKGILA